MTSWFGILKTAGIDPCVDSCEGSPFETVAAEGAGEIVQDRRDNALWYLDYSGEPKNKEAPYDAPARPASLSDVDAMNARQMAAGV